MLKQNNELSIIQSFLSSWETFSSSRNLLFLKNLNVHYSYYKSPIPCLHLNLTLSCSVFWKLSQPILVSSVVTLFSHLSLVFPSSIIPCFPRKIRMHILVSPSVLHAQFPHLLCVITPSSSYFSISLLPSAQIFSSAFFFSATSSKILNLLTHSLRSDNMEAHNRHDPEPFQHSLLLTSCQRILPVPRQHRNFYDKFFWPYAHSCSRGLHLSQLSPNCYSTDLHILGYSSPSKMEGHIVLWWQGIHLT